MELLATADREFVLLIARKHDLASKIEEALSAMSRPAGDVRLDSDKVTVSPSNVSMLLLESTLRDDGKLSAATFYVTSSTVVVIEVTAGGSFETGGEGNSWPLLRVCSR
jgi:hypothetical protein